MNAPAVAIVKTDHQITIRVNTRRVPIRSAHQAVGISKIAYARAKALNTQPICLSLRLKSPAMSDLSTEMQARSKYVTTASSTAIAATR